MATPGVLHVFVLDDGVSEISSGAKSFFMLDIYKEDRLQHADIHTSDVPKVLEMQFSYTCLNLSDLSVELRNVFRSTNYENYFELRKALWNYALQQTLSKHNCHIENVDNKLLLINYLSTLSQIVSKTKQVYLK